MIGWIRQQTPPGLKMEVCESFRNECHQDLGVEFLHFLRASCHFRESYEVREGRVFITFVECLMSGCLWCLRTVGVDLSRCWHVQSFWQVFQIYICCLVVFRRLRQWEVEGFLELPLMLLIVLHMVPYVLQPRSFCWKWNRKIPNIVVLRFLWSTERALLPFYTLSMLLRKGISERCFSYSFLWQHFCSLPSSMALVVF